MRSTPITPETAATIAEIVRIVDAIDRATDARDWPLVRSFFADRLRADFASLTGEPAAEIAADDLVGGWAANLRGPKTSQHLRGNHQVALDGDRATCVSAAHAWNRMEGNGDPLWEVWGTYTHSLSRTAAGWRVDGMALEVTHQRGSPWVRDTRPEG
jgi:ketosteroid isomerase-like protein